MTAVHVLAALVPAVLPGEPAGLDLSDWIALAMENSPGLSVSEAGTERAEASWSAARASLLPQLSFSASAGHAWTSGSSFYPGGTDDETYSAGLTLTQELLAAGGASWLSLEAAGHAREGASQEMRSAELQLQHDVAVAYYEAVEASGLLASARASLERSRAVLDRTRMLYDLGAARELELLQAGMQESGDRLAVLQREQALTLSLAELARAAGLEADGTLGIDTSAVLRPLGSQDIALLPMDWSGNPGLLSASSSVESARLELSSAERQWWPSLTAGGSWSWSDNRFDTGEIPENDSWSVRVTLSWSVFDGWLRESRVQSASAALLAARATLEETGNALAAAMERAIAALESSAANLELAELTLDYALRRMELSRMTYELGDMQIADLLDAQAALSEAEAGVVSARIACLEAEADYWLAAGMSPRTGE